MGFLDRISYALYRALGGGNTAQVPEPSSEPMRQAPVRRPSRRGYSAARQDRLTADWIFAPVTADQEVRQGLQVVRARARDLAINDSYIRGYLRACRRNIVGSSGFAISVKARNPDGSFDVYANRLIETKFAEWSKKGTCDVSGRFSFRKLQGLIVTAVKRDGECFIRKVKGRNVNQFGFALQLLGSEAVDETYNGVALNGNEIRLGVEIDKWRKPVAYYFKVAPPGSGMYATAQTGGPYERVPAEDVIHAYDPDQYDQTRDVSSMTAVMTRVRHLSGYEEAAVVNARAGACKMGFFRDPTSTEGEYQGDDEDSDGNAIVTAEAGTFEDIGTREFQEYNPTFPSDLHGPFVKSMLYGMATGLGISYASLSQDLSDANFSNARTGLVEEREEWKEQQQWLIENVLNDVFASWLEMAFLVGQLGNLPAAKFEKFNAPVWTGRRWAWVDPEKDVAAQTSSVRAGLTSPSQIAAEQGQDLEDIYEQLARDKEMAKEYGLTLDFGGKEVTANAGAQGKAGTGMQNA